MYNLYIYTYIYKYMYNSYIYTYIYKYMYNLSHARTQTHIHTHTKNIHYHASLYQSERSRVEGEDSLGQGAPTTQTSTQTWCLASSWAEKCS